MRPSALPAANSNVVFSHIVSHGSVAHFKKRQVVFSQGSRSNALFHVAYGSVKLSVSSEQGREAILDILGSGSLFGEDAILSNHDVRLYSAVCLTDVEVTKIDHVQLLEILKERADVSYALIMYLLKRLRGVQVHLADCLINASDKRLRNALLSIADQNQNGGRLPKLSQQTLADMIGTTRQRVNALLKERKRLGPRVLPPRR